MGPAGHACLCAKCLGQLKRRESVEWNRAFECPLCKKPVERIEKADVDESTSSMVCEMLASDANKSDEVSAALIPMIMKAKEIRDVISIVFEMYSEHQEPWAILLSPVSVEVLLQCCAVRFPKDHPDFYKLKNTFVALCRTPWCVDGEIAGCGSCYFGNYGEDPMGLEHAWKLIVYNRRRALVAFASTRLEIWPGP